MAAEPLFVDSGGFYALVSPDSERHELTVDERASPHGCAGDG
jgi:hypothetical protein